MSKKLLDKIFGKKDVLIYDSEKDIPPELKKMINRGNPMKEPTGEKISQETSPKHKLKVAPESIKSWYENNKTKIPTLFSFVKDCVSYSTRMRENPGIIDYVDLAFGVKDSYDEYYGDSNPRNYFANQQWQPMFHEAFLEYIVNLLTQYRQSAIHVLKSNDNTTTFLAKLSSTELGWATLNGEVKFFWVRANQKEAAFAELRQLFWQRHPSQRVVVTVDNDKLSIKDDLNHGNFIISGKCIEYGSYIKKFRSGGLSRSLLFYGPPGSGKSNLVKGICNFLHARSVRFENLNAINNNFVTEIIKVVGPDCIILEDIDHLGNDEIVDLLDKIEDFNHEGKLVFATANRVSKLDNALLRPGRFDEAIEIKTIDEEVVLKLVEGDTEIFEVVKSFPVAFTVELMKRVKILGKEEALNNMQDLHDRIANFSLVNYELKAQTSNSPTNPSPGKNKKSKGGYTYLRGEAKDRGFR